MRREPALTCAVILFSASTLGTAASPIDGDRAVARPRPAASHLDVQVVDARGEPVEGAELHLSCAGLCDERCTTSTDGTCRLRQVPLEEEVYLGVHHVEHERWSERIVLHENASRRLVRLPAPPWAIGSAEGRVTDDRGEPVVGARLSLTEMMEHSADVWNSVTDADGRFQVARIPEGSYYAQVAVEGFVPAVVGHWIGDGAPSLEIRLERGATIRGAIAELPGEMCPGAVVRAWQVFERNGFRMGMPFRGPPPMQIEADVDERGGFALHDVPTGHFRIRLDNRTCSRDGIETLVEVRAGDRDLWVDLEPLVYEPSPKPPIAGVVRDAHTGKGLEGARVLVVSRTETSVGVTGEPVVTDADGRFAFSFSVPSVELRATRDGYTTRYVPWDEVGPAEIELEPTEGLRYRVRWHDGDEPTAVELSLTDATGRRIEESHATGNGHWQDAPEGEFVLRVEHVFSATEMPVTIPGPTVDLELPPGGATRLRIPELEAGYGDGWLDGVTVEARRSTGEVVRTRETIFVEGLAPGSWTITVTVADGRSWSGRAEIRDREWSTTYLR